MGLWEKEIAEILMDLRCPTHGKEFLESCKSCKIWFNVGKTLKNIDEAHEVSMMACAIKQSAIQLLTMWMEHAKGCTAKPEDN